MIRFRHFNLLFAGLLVGWALSSSVVGQHGFTNRRGVDIGKTQSFGYFDGPLKRASMGAELRGFIWEHWSQKRRGRIAARFYSIDSSPTTQTVEIRPDRSENWIVVSTVEKKCSRIFAVLWPQCWFDARTTVETFDILSRVEPATTPVPFVGELPDLETISGDRIEVITTRESRSPEKYRLSFQSTIRPDSNWLL